MGRDALARSEDGMDESVILWAQMGDWRDWREFRVRLADSVVQLHKHPVLIE